MLRERRDEEMSTVRSEKIESQIKKLIHKYCLGKRYLRGALIMNIFLQQKEMK